MVQFKLKKDGEEGSKNTDVPFAELVMHRLEEEGIELHDPLNKTVVKRFSEALDEKSSPNTLPAMGLPEFSRRWPGRLSISMC